MHSEPTGALPGSDERDYPTPSRDEVSALLKSGDLHTRMFAMAGSALVVGFGLGWGCGGNFAGPNPITQTETTLRRTSEIRPGATVESPRKLATLTKPLEPSSVIPAPKPHGTSSANTRALNNATAPPPTQVSMTSAAREPLVPAADTKPTTIEGWTVLDVRGGTIVLAGPDGVRTAATGDIVPGVGRIESVVRWGNRWIVATATGLIATP